MKFNIGFVLALSLSSSAASIGFAKTNATAKAAEPAPASSVTAPTASATCVGCHGPAGISANDLWPNIAGQKREYIAKQLRAFHSGERTDPMMSAIAQTLTDTDIVELAKYFSNLKGAQ